MSDLPTRDEVLATSELDHLVALPYVKGDLLTREEAANDEQVQRMVFDNWQVQERLLTLGQVADLFAISKDAVYARRSRGGFPPAIRLGGLLRWRSTDIEAWLNENTEDR